MFSPMFGVYLGGAFAQFTPEEVLARQQEIINLLDPSISVLRPKHQGAYPSTLGALTDAVLTTRDRLMVGKSDVLVLDCLGATSLSRGSLVEIGWADELRKPVVLVAEEGNPHIFNMSLTLARFIVPTRQTAADVVNALLT